MRSSMAFVDKAAHDDRRTVSCSHETPEQAPPLTHAEIAIDPHSGLHDAVCYPEDADVIITASEMPQAQGTGAGSALATISTVDAVNLAMPNDADNAHIPALSAAVNVLLG